MALSDHLHAIDLSSINHLAC